MIAEEKLRQLEARIRELEDDREIRELLARYGFLADMGRDREYVELYTEDGTLDVETVMRAGIGYKGIVRFKGRDALMAFITDPKAHKAMQGKCVHVQGNNLRTHIRGDEAIRPGIQELITDGLRGRRRVASQAQSGTGARPSSRPASARSATS